MNTSKSEIKIKDVAFEKGNMVVELSDRRIISVPLDWFPRLQNAKLEELLHWEVAAAGHGIHWPELDEDISVDGLLFGQASAEATKHMHQ